MKRIIYMILITITVIAILGGVTSFASYDSKNLTRGGILLAESDIEPDITTPSEASGDSSLTEGDGSGTVSGDDINNDTDEERNTEKNEGTSVEENAEDEDVGGTDDDAASNPFATLFNTVKEYATEIFCSLTFVGSLLLAYAYKKGLIPLLQGGITAISGAVTKIKESAERGESKTDELTRTVCDRLADAEVCLDGIGSTLGELERKLDEVSASERETSKMKLVMSAQVDMLYSIFMTSALPQYQKDEVGERINQMKEALLADEGE